MDLSLFDVTDIVGEQPEDEVVLFGQQGDATINVDEMAERCGNPRSLDCRAANAPHNDNPMIYLKLKQQLDGLK